MEPIDSGLSSVGAGLPDGSLVQDGYDSDDSIKKPSPKLQAEISVNLDHIHHKGPHGDVSHLNHNPIENHLQQVQTPNHHQASISNAQEHIQLSSLLLETQDSSIKRFNGERNLSHSTSPSNGERDLSHMISPSNGERNLSHSVSPSKASTLKSNNDFDIESFQSNTVVESGNEETTEPEYNPDELKKIANLAGIFLDTKKAFLNDNNILDSEQHPGEFDTKSGDASKISRATLIRAERVKTSLALKYLGIDQIYSTEIQYPGIDGVYNPLQIIRNRRLRSKYREPPKALSVKTLPLASNVFSKHNIYRDANSKKMWKSIWAVELNEFISDQSWKGNHIHELKNSKGELWFPASSNNSVNSKEKLRPTTYPKLHEKHHARFKRRLHDKLFNEEDSASGSFQSIPDRTRMLAFNDTKGKRDRFKERVKKSLGYNTSSSSSLEDTFNMTKIESPSKVDTSLADDESSPKDVNSSSEADDDLNKLLIKPIDKRDSLESPNLLHESDNNEALERSDTHAEVDEIIDNQLIDISKELNHLRHSNNIKYHFLSEVLPRLQISYDRKLRELVDDRIPKLNNLMIDINDDSIPAYELHCSTLLNEIKSLMRIINDDYSVRIDNLLTGTDRLTGEISTSMSLELRKVDEQLDKLNNSLFGNLVTDALNQNKDSLSISDSGNYRMLYLFLENFIVVILRLTWVVVNIMNVFLWVFRMIWKVLKVI